jgi:hypothetical protein
MERISSSLLSLFETWDHKTCFSDNSSSELITSVVLRILEREADPPNFFSTHFSQGVDENLRKKIQTFLEIYETTNNKSIEEIEKELELDSWDAGQSSVVAKKRIVDSYLKKASLLNLSDLNLETLPGCLSRLSHLTELNIQKNKLLSIPDMPEIKILRCSQNRLTHIQTFQNLQILDCSQNELTLIEDQPKLETLSAQKNALMEIPNFKNLKILDASSNFLTSLPILKKLKILSVHNNKLTSLPLLENLKKLNCSFNEILSLPHFPMLEIADVSYNKLKTIPHFQNLTYLKCFHNELSEKPLLPQKISLFFLPQKVTTFSKFRNKIDLLLQNHKNKSFRDINYDFFKSIEESPFIPNFFLFLEKLEEQTFFRGKSGKKLLTEAILEIINAIANHPEYYDIASTEIEESVSTCSDKTLFTLNQLTVSSKLLSVSEQNEKIKILKGAYVLEILRNIALKILNHREEKEMLEKERALTKIEKDHVYAEEIEVYLALQVHFKDEYHLPIFSSSMLYRFAADLSKEEINFAEETLLSKYNSKTQLIDFIHAQKQFVDSLRKLHPDPFLRSLSFYNDQLDPIIKRIELLESESSEDCESDLKEFNSELHELRHSAATLMQSKIAADEAIEKSFIEEALSAAST